MEGEASWLTFLVVAGGGVFVLGLVYLAQLRRRHRRVRKEVMCPKSGELVRATLVQDNMTGRWIDVVRCSAFKPSDRILCERQCVAELGEVPGL